MGPSHRRRASKQPAPKARWVEIAIVARPYQQMEVIGHQAVGQQSHIEARNRLNQHLLVCRIVVIAVEDRQARVRSVQNMIDQAAFYGSLWSWHSTTIG
jgi:hypothetical protein